MDDGSAPPLFQVPDWGIPREALHFSYFTPDTRRSVYQQLHAYDECWRLHRHSHTWIANLDADEYLEMTSTTRNETLVSFLQEFEDDDEVGAVGVNWITHTSSGHLTRPPSTRKGFTTCIEDDDAGHNRHIKSIVRTDRYRRSYNAHHVDLASGTITVGEHGDECDGPFRTPITRDRIALHHYALGSWEQFQEKLSRGNGMGDPKGQWFWDDVESLPSYTCDSMAKYEP
ncbi:hypothetical protein HKX48_005277 [Thoreauomyces humboldtii]|nr:hypothetical protein HKX48_005277 [Thoreauomyces humboldtii]